MHILLTRQLEDCSELIVRFKKLGHIVSHLPLLIVEKISYNHELFNGCKSIIFTSANGIKFLGEKAKDIISLILLEPMEFILLNIEGMHTELA